MTTEPEHIKAILSTDFASFEKGKSRRRVDEGVIGSNGSFGL
jgi:hypothetical protein